MTSFDDRQKAYEKKFTLDAELKFKAEARRNKLVSAWAAEKLGITGEDAVKAYAKEVQRADFEEAGDDDVFRKLAADFKTKGVSISDADIRAAMVEKMEEAIRQVES